MHNNSFEQLCIESEITYNNVFVRLIGIGWHFSINIEETILFSMGNIPVSSDKYNYIRLYDY